MTTLLDVLPPLAVADLADGGRVDSEPLGDDLVRLRVGTDLPNVVIGEFVLRDFLSARSTAMPLPIVGILLSGPSNDVRRVDTSVVAAEMPSVSATTSGLTPDEDQGCAVHAHSAPVQTHQSVMTCLGASASLERMWNALIRRVRNKISNGRPEPREFRSAHRPAASRVPVLPVPVVVGLAESECVMRSGAVVETAKFFGHADIMSCARSCCLLGVPTT